MNVFNHIGSQIIQQQRLWQSQYFDPHKSEHLPLHHQAHVGILDSYSNHLTLMMHHNNAVKAMRNGQSESWSRQRCLESARRLLDLHANLQDSPYFIPFRWYNYGLGSFHAFHAAVILLILCRDTLEDVRPALQQCLERFRSMSELSPLCQKAAPLLQMLFDRIDQRTSIASSQRLQQRLHSQESPSNQPFTAQQLQTPLSLVGSTVDDSILQMTPETLDWNTLLPELQAQQWLTPASLPWDQWSSIMSNHGPAVTI